MSTVRRQGFLEKRLVFERRSRSDRITRMKETRSITAWMSVALLLLVVGAYFGAYYTLLQPRIVVRIQDPDRAARRVAMRNLGYRSDSFAVGLLFVPAHLIDLQIRPAYWGDLPP
jgi:hypothetical protein